MTAMQARPVGRPARRASARCSFLWLLGALLVTPALGHADSARPEYEVKAAYLLNFTRYVKWPEEAFGGPHAPLVVGILGTDPFGDTIDRVMRGRTSHGRRLVIRRLGDVSEASECHVLFIDDNAASRRAALREVSGKPVLTVGEGRKFIREGGAITLVIKSETVQFRVNLGATARVGLELSSRMLHLAEEVLTSERAGSDE